MKNLIAAQKQLADSQRTRRAAREVRHSSPDCGGATPIMFLTTSNGLILLCFDFGTQRFPAVRRIIHSFPFFSLRRTVALVATVATPPKIRSSRSPPVPRDASHWWRCVRPPPQKWLARRVERGQSPGRNESLFDMQVASAQGAPMAQNSLCFQ